MLSASPIDAETRSDPYHPGRRILAALLTAASLAVTPLCAQSPGGSQPIASEQLGGTVLTVSPQIAYERAVLRVSGPEDYALTKRFVSGAPIAADLLTEAEAWTESAISPEPRSFLPDGRYRYEVVFTDVAGDSRVHTGMFFVEGGSAIGRGVKQATLRATREDLAVAATDPPLPRADGDVGAEGLTVDNFLDIHDEAQDGVTFLELDSIGVPSWNLINHSGQLRLGAGVFYRISIEYYGQVGMGTTAPQQDLHLVDSDGADIRLSGSGADWDLAIVASSNQFVIQDVTTAANIFRVSQGAPDASLVIATTGVGVGTAVPAATLHVNGSGIIEGDVALGSSRTIKHQIELLDSDGVLAAIRELPIYGWKYRDDPNGTPHVGPMAEDVHQAFGVGRDEKHLSPADTAGLALSAIQGLDARLDRELDELRGRNTNLATENRLLRQRLEAIEKLIARSPGAP